ncbi:MAG: hypothetical protein ACI37R_02315 [Candidatus Avigastranaerophilus sp.]
MKLKKFALLLLFVPFTLLTVNAEMYTQSLTVGETKEGMTKYNENKDNSLYKIEGTANSAQTQSAIVPYTQSTVQYLPVAYPYGYSGYSSYGGTSIRYYSRPYTCFKEPCQIITRPPHMGYPPSVGGGGMQIHTNFAGGYNFGGNPNSWTTYQVGRPNYGRPPMGGGVH